MKIIIRRSFIILVVTFGSAYAETVYVTDNLNLALRSQESSRSKAITGLPIGTPLTVIKANSKTGFTRVRLNNGMEGYFLTRHITKEPPAGDPMETDKKILKLQAENTVLKTELATVKNAIKPGTTLEQSLANERDQLKRELGELKKTAASPIQIKNERDELQERLVSVERDLQQFKLENQALKDTTHQDWFLYGGTLALAGVLLGFILPKLGWRRKSSWDSY